MCLRETDASTRFRFPRTDEEESALVSETRPKSTKYKNKWAVEIFREWQRTRNFQICKLEAFSKITTFILCVMSRTLFWRI